MPDSQFNGVVATWEWDVATRQLTWSPELEAFYGLGPEAFKAAGRLEL